MTDNHLITSRPVYEQQRVEHATEIKGLPAALKAKEQGNNFFRAGDYSRAVGCYAQVLEFATPIAHEVEAESVMLTALSNRTLCLIKLSRFRDARESAEAALKLRVACRANPIVATKVALRLASAARKDPGAGGAIAARRAVLEVGCSHTCTQRLACACTWLHSIHHAGAQLGSTQWPGR